MIGWMIGWMIGCMALWDKTGQIRPKV